MGERAGGPPRGTLHVVATPIGNLDDLGARAAQVLGGCAVIAAEDTRRLRILAQRYGFRPRRVVRCDEHAERRAVPVLLGALEAGEDVALTSDAGTPGVADPGARVVRAALGRGFRVVPVPGPCAPVAALSVSGLQGDRFAFAGFPPRRAGPRGAFLEELLRRPETTVLLESPERLASLIVALADRAPRREVVVARELTKVHEEVLRGSAEELAAELGRRGEVRGEAVVVVAGDAGDEAAGQEPPGLARARELLDRPWAQHLSGRDLADLLATACGLDRNAAYRLAAARTRGSAPVAEDEIEPAP